MHTLPIIAVVLGIVAMITIGQEVERRRRLRIANMIAQRGGRVVSIRMTSPPSWQRVARYIGPQGELREACVSTRTGEFDDDRPFQLVLKEEVERSRSSDLLRSLKLAAKLQELPGHQAYTTVIRQLACGATESISIEESSADPDQERRFAPILQCLEAAAITSKRAADQILELVVDGKTNLDVQWSVHGQPPRRALILKALHSQPRPSCS